MFKYSQSDFEARPNPGWQDLGLKWLLANQSVRLFATRWRYSDNNNGDDVADGNRGDGDGDEDDEDDDVDDDNGGDGDGDEDGDDDDDS